MDDFEQFLKDQPLRAVPAEWRTEILAAAQKPSKATPQRNWLYLWLWPSPYAWGALAAVWVAIFILNSATQPGRSLTPPGMPAPTVDEIVAMLNEHRRELDEFMPKAQMVMTTPPPAVQTGAPGACLFPHNQVEPQYV